MSRFCHKAVFLGYGNSAGNVMGCSDGKLHLLPVVALGLIADVVISCMPESGFDFWTVCVGVKEK
jgi:hypothetical protein